MKCPFENIDEYDCESRSQFCEESIEMQHDRECNRADELNDERRINAEDCREEERVIEYHKKYDK